MQIEDLDSAFASICKQHENFVFALFIRAFPRDLLKLHQVSRSSMGIVAKARRQFGSLIRMREKLGIRRHVKTASVTIVFLRIIPSGSFSTFRASWLSQIENRAQKLFGYNNYDSRKIIELIEESGIQFYLTFDLGSGEVIDAGSSPYFENLIESDSRLRKALEVASNQNRLYSAPQVFD